MSATDSQNGSAAPLPVGRRAFIKTAGAAAAAVGGIEGILAARRAPAFAQGTKLHWVRWVDFIPESDVELKRQMPEASKALGAEVVFETINANDLQPRITAAIQSGSGADIFNFQYNWAHLYQNALVEASDVAGELAKAEGGFYEVYPPSCSVNGHWLAVPHSIVGNAVAYRKSWLREAGASQYPKTWEEARKVFAVLKKKGKPYGQTLGHTFGDAPTFTYTMLWAFGGAETDSAGKKVVIDSKGTVESVKFMQAFWKECCDEG
ncbi:MAG TPA: extracellular solute-binding protein, partial [Candidatus Methylomirabilis sp.]|nr:extracellular solute-binding protein [Candidatus Methylomirabilis sp.]